MVLHFSVLKTIFSALAKICCFSHSFPSKIKWFGCFYKFSIVLKKVFLKNIKPIGNLEVKYGQLKGNAWKPWVKQYFRFWCSRTQPLEGNIRSGKGSLTASSLSYGLFPEFRSSGFTDSFFSYFLRLLDRSKELLLLTLRWHGGAIAKDRDTLVQRELYVEGGVWSASFSTWKATLMNEMLRKL